MSFATAKDEDRWQAEGSGLRNTVSADQQIAGGREMEGAEGEKSLHTQIGPDGTLVTVQQTIKRAKAEPRRSLEDYDAEMERLWSVIEDFETKRRHLLGEDIRNALMDARELQKQVGRGKDKKLRKLRKSKVRLIRSSAAF